MVYLPREVANAIDCVWENRENPNDIKYLLLNNWAYLQTNFPMYHSVLIDYATKNPLNYMKALTEGYEIEFDRHMSFSVNALTASYADPIVKDNNFKNNFPIKVQVGSAWEILSIGETKELSENLLLLLQELDKVRSTL